MAYLGNTSSEQNFVPQVDYFSGDGSTAAFTLSRPVASVYQVEAVVNNVIQNPSDAFTVNGNVITFTSAPPAGSNNVYVRFAALNTSVATIGQSPVIDGDLVLSDVGAFIKGDFSNSLTYNHSAFQTNIPNGSTGVHIVPHGTGTVANLNVWNNSSRVGASGCNMLVNSSEASLRANFSDGSAPALPLTFYTNNNERIRIGTDGVVGLTSGQLKFPATQNASSDPNTLDDYEEGSWTPVDNSGAGLTFSAFGGRYVKVGRFVQFWFRAHYPATSNTATANIGGLPYVSSPMSGGLDVSGGWNTILSQNFDNAYSGYVGLSVSSFIIYGLVSGQSNAKSNANVSGQNIYGYGSYITSA